MTPRVEDAGMAAFTNVGKSAAGLLLPLVLAACAPSIPPPSVQTVAAPSRFQHGTVAAIRPVAIGTDPGSAAGIAAVLAGLQAGTAPSGAGGEEVVVRLRDDSVLTVMEGQGAPNFAVGDAVAVADIGGKALIRRGD